MGLNALHGVRVIDLSHVIAGPTASHYLALEGADVIKIEQPGQGDILRARPRELLDDGVPVGFAAINAGKRSLALNLKDERGRDILRRLIPTADVFIENFRPGAVARMGFDEASVRALRADIIYASISGFGQEGAWGQRAAYDHVVQSAIGMGMMQGLEGEEPMKVGFPVIDTATGLVGAQALLAALIRRFRDGQGAYLDISMAQAGLQLMWPEVARVAFTGQDAPRVGNRGFSGSPGAATFRCADGWISTAANTSRQFGALCEALGQPDLIRDAELIDQEALARGGFLVARDPARVHERLSAAFSSLAVEALEHELARREVPCARLRPLSEVVPLFSQGGTMTLPVRRTPHARGTLTDFGPGYKADRRDEAALTPAPRLGQHSRVLLGELGLSGADVDALIASGVVGAPVDDGSGTR